MPFLLNLQFKCASLIFLPAEICSWNTLFILVWVCYFSWVIFFVCSNNTTLMSVFKLLELSCCHGGITFTSIFLPMLMKYRKTLLHGIYFLLILILPLLWKKEHIANRWKQILINWLFLNSVFTECFLLSFCLSHSYITERCHNVSSFLSLQVSWIVFVVFQTALLKRQSRYIHSTVPENAEKEAQSLFVTEVIIGIAYDNFVCNSNIIFELVFFCFIYHLKTRK